jgi:catechol 2,3-dioxygenase-like lactoylglutathione lyase family enzyme
MTAPRTRVSAFVLGAPDARVLAAFYRDLLGWDVTEDEPDWVRLRPPAGGTGLSFQTERHHVPPAWPGEAGAQQTQAHLDVAVEDLDAGVAHALALGATLAAYQPQDDVRVLLDPAGHPFCLFAGAV